MPNQSKYSQETRLASIESIMVKISRMRSVGCYTAIQTVEDFIKTLIKSPKLAARLKPSHLDEFTIKTLIDLEITQTDLDILAKRRIDNRELLTEILIKMLERGSLGHHSVSVVTGDLEEALRYRAVNKFINGRRNRSNQASRYIRIR